MGEVNEIIYSSMSDKNLLKTNLIKFYKMAIVIRKWHIKIVMNLSSIVLISLVTLYVHCQENDNDIRYFGFVDGFYDTSKTFWQKLRDKYQWFMNREDVSNRSKREVKDEGEDDDEDEDKYLMLVGNGQAFDRVVINKSFDDGLTYQSYWQYEPIKLVCEYLFTNTISMCFFFNRHFIFVMISSSLSTFNFE